MGASMDGEGEKLASALLGFLKISKLKEIYHILIKLRVLF
jgi:hypothetical protein